ncbi:PQQ-binding-like beta-propeller repeat protein [Cellulomonas soli]|uniref:outer membrane protein assembly factor BamB family protein n=1 Tax=Cellulomonas soli TaxID=931535 RepID=UPI003F87553E
MGGMADVELVEDEERPRRASGRDATSSGLATPVEPDDGPAPDPAGRDPRLRRLRRVALAGLAVLVTGLVVTQQVVDAQERERLTRYSDVAGVLAPLRPDAHELWRRSARTDMAFPQWSVVGPRGDLLLGGVVDTDGSVTLTAVEPDTGADVWTVDVELTAGPPRTDFPGSVSCLPEPAPPAASAPSAATASCLVTLPEQLVDLASEDGSTYQYALGRSALLLIDTATGEVLEHVEAPLGTQFRSLPGGYVTATPDVTLDPAWTTPEDIPPSAVTVARYDWGETTPLWTFRTTPEADGFGRNWVFGDAQQVMVESGSTVWLLDADDGALIGSLTGPDGYSGSTMTIPGGGVVSSSYAGAGPSSQMLTAAGTVTDLSGLTPVTRLVDDGSASDVVLLAEMTANWSTGALVAVDARTGARRWESEGTAGWSAIVLGGVVYTSAGRELAAVDAQDGSVLWARDLTSSDAQLLTDGSAAILAGEGRIDAYDLRDGTPLWSSLVVSTDGSAALQPLTGAPSVTATAAGGLGDRDSWVTMVGRHLALMSPTGEMAVLG